MELCFLVFKENGVTDIMAAPSIATVTEVVHIVSGDRAVYYCTRIVEKAIRTDIFHRNAVVQNRL